MTHNADRSYIPGRRIEDVRKETGLVQIHKLASNENPLGPSPRAIAALGEVLAGISEYPDMSAVSARASIAQHLGVPVESVILGAGSDEVLMLASCAALGPGKTAIVLEPTFPQYRSHSVARGAEVIAVPIAELDASLDRIVAAAQGRTGVVWLANPNNPTGTVVATEALSGLLRNLGREWLLVLDEAYVDFRASEPGGAIELLRDHDNLLITRTFSKIYGLAGLRVGYGIGASDLIDRLQAFRGPFNTSALAQAAVAAALADSDHFNHSRQVNAQGREQLLEFLRRRGLQHYASDASFVLLRPPIAERACIAHLEKCGYVLRPGTDLGAPGMIRITIGTPQQMEGLITALDAIRDGSP